MMLRRCRTCGLIADSKETLELFVKNPKAPHGRSNQCKKCWNADHRAGGKYHYIRVAGAKRWRENHPNEFKEKYQRQFSYKGRNISTLKTNPRKNICSLCGKKYPAELKQQTRLHHLLYDDLNPLANTIELCNPCHLKLHNQMKKEKLQKFLEDAKAMIVIRRRPKDIEGREVPTKDEAAGDLPPEPHLFTGREKFEPPKW